MAAPPVTLVEQGLPPAPVKLSEIVSALSYALDLVEGQPEGHAIRCCLIGLRIGSHLGLSHDQLRDLYFALLMKDAGCSSNASRMCQIVAGDEIAAKAGVKLTDWTKSGLENLIFAWRHIAPGAPLTEKISRILSMALNKKQQSKELVQIRCDRGASIAREMGLSDATADAIRSLDEHWNGGGYPDGLIGEEIPLLARILSISQTLEVYWREQGPDKAIAIIQERSKRWFDPKLARVAIRLAKDQILFADLDTGRARQLVVEMEPPEDAIPLTGDQIDNICTAFAAVVDAKSPYTFRHSLGVTSAAIGISQKLSLAAPLQSVIRRAALLHDVGKLSVPNSILEKNGKLDDAEWQIVRRHPFYTHQILSRIPGFTELAEIAASHHEKLNGKGYWRGLDSTRLPIASRLLVVADIYDALAAERPYRGALPPEQVFSIIDKEVPDSLDGDCVQALKECVFGGELDMIVNIRRLQSILAAEQHAMPAPETIPDSQLI
jgi:HD-GYP domain-containing protein (c-di-GMP phosphodiesterase class II)